MAATAILETEKVLQLLNRSTDLYHIWRGKSIGDVLTGNNFGYDILKKSKMVATAILET